MDGTRIALASSYGLPAREVERAFERGVRFFFWGALRRGDFGGAVRRLARRERDVMTIAIQSFARSPWMLRPSVEIARRRLGVDTIDVLGLGFWNVPPPRAIVDAALQLESRGLVRSLVVSCHARPTFDALLADDAYDGVMVRYNAAHTGAERDALPRAQARNKRVLAYTATRWGTLLREGAAPSGDAQPRGADCYRFVLSHPAVTTCLAGPKDAAELDGVLEALARGPMDDAELAWMRRVGAHVRAQRAVAAPPRPGAAWEHARGIARELWERGITEGLVSRFNK
jgi:aryl-alcohol dehydrogenase-like predicted oxidoreductase